MAAETPFDIADIERILKALFPDTGENPLGDLREQLVKIREDMAAQEAVWDARQDELDDDLDAIKTRTFGILILQIINVVRTLMGLLPAGRVILLAIAALGLITTLLNNGSVTSADVRAAIEQSGLSGFIREQLRRLQDLANDQAERVEQVVALGENVLDAATVRAAGVSEDLRFMAGELGRVINSVANATSITDTNTLQAELEAIERVIFSAAATSAENVNLTSNLDSLIFGALRAVPERVRELPTLAAKLVE